MTLRALWCVSPTSAHKHISKLPEFNGALGNQKRYRSIISAMNTIHANANILVTAIHCSPMTSIPVMRICLVENSELPN